MSNLKRGSPIPKPAADPLDCALAELKKLPVGERLAKGKPYLRTIVEIVLKHPNRSAAIEDADIACGAGIVKARDLRAEVERAAIDLLNPPKPAPGTVTVNVELAERMRREWRQLDEPARRGDYNPFTTERIFNEDVEVPARWFPPF
jgi:hypothetical protein